MPRNVIIISMIILLIVLFYVIFNYGSPTGLQRHIIRQPAYDLWLLIGLGLGVFVLNLLLIRDNERRRRE